jgi:hypothetical protein
MQTSPRPYDYSRADVLVAEDKARLTRFGPLEYTFLPLRRRAFALPLSGTSCPTHLCARLRLLLQFRGHVNNKNPANCYNDQPPYIVAQGLHGGMDLCLTYRDGGG